MTTPFLDRDEVIRHRNGSTWLGKELLIFRETDSTNERAFDLASRGCKEGLVVCAESQTNGRGQFGRRWESAAGLGLWFSVVIRCPETWTDFTPLTWWVAGALAPALNAMTGLAVGIKSPNDLLVGGRKLGGILVETRADAGGRIGVAGIGLNVLQTADDFPEPLRATATSLRLEKEELPTRERILAGLLDALEASYQLLLEKPDQLGVEFSRHLLTGSTEPTLTS